MALLRRYGRPSLWFLPALIAFASALIVIAQQRPPFRLKVPMPQREIQKVEESDRGPMNLAIYKGEAEFANPFPAILKVKVHDRLLDYEPEYTVEIFRDGQPYDSMLGKVEKTRILSEGYHTYRVAAESRQLTSSYPQSVTEMTVLLEYPTNPVRWQAPGLLGGLFLLIGAFQQKRLRGK